jgi:hypothetical protein
MLSGFKNPAFRGTAARERAERSEHGHRRNYNIRIRLAFGIGTP